LVYKLLVATRIKKIHRFIAYRGQKSKADQPRLTAGEIVIVIVIKLFLMRIL